MKNPYRARVSRREFLNLPGIHDGAYVVAYVEDTSEREIESDYGRAYNPHPRFILEIADCTRRINLEFEIDSALHRSNSFHKVDTLIAALEELREGLAAECALYREREAEIERLEKEQKAAEQKAQNKAHRTRRHDHAALAAAAAGEIRRRR